MKFYEVYPVHKEKKAAFIAWSRAIKITTKDTLMEGLDRFNKAIREGKAGDYIKHPPAWLNKGCWDDEYEKPNDRKNNREYSEANAPKARVF